MGKKPDSNKKTRYYSEEEITWFKIKKKKEKDDTVQNWKIDGRLLMHGSEQQSQSPVSAEKGLLPAHPWKLQWRVPQMGTLK